MTRPEVIRKRLTKINEYLDILEKEKQIEEETFLTNYQHYGSTERFLQLCIEALDDMGNHVIADNELGFIDNYSDIPKIFDREGLINEEESEQWMKMIGFRNILVHDYLQVNRKRVYDILQNNLDDLRSLRDVFIQFL